MSIPSHEHIGGSVLPEDLSMLRSIVRARVDGGFEKPEERRFLGEVLRALIRARVTLAEETPKH